jgi:hypothetical protein
MFQSHFYHETIRNTVVAFGTLFDDIKVQKLNADGTERISIQVPLAYAAREKYIQRLKEDSRLNDDEYPNTHVQMTLPRMSFNMTSLNYDASRKRNTIHRRRIKDTSGTQENLSYQYAEVPYNLGFELAVYASTFEDGLQIVEQVVPYFTPEFNVTFQKAGGTSDMNTKIDLPIVLEGVNLDYDFLGEMETRRLLNWTLTFNVKSYLYGPVRRDKTIIYTQATLYDLGDGLTSGQVAGLCGATGAVSRIDIGISGGTGIFIDGSQEDPNAIPPYTFMRTEYQFNNPAGSGTGDVIDGGGETV